jgi:two-component system phosphate regulon sensor histidine kinase PhoR
MSSNELRKISDIDVNQQEIQSLKRKQSSMAAEIEQLKKVKLKLEEESIRIKKEQVEYLQNVSHQLVAPLNAMKWHIENLTQGRIHSAERINKVLRSIYAQSTISVHLAKNFALMSNLEADHKLSNIKEPPEPICLCRLLVNLADDFQPLGWDKDIHIKVIDQPFNSAPDILAVKTLIAQVFSNIIENAVKYSDSLTEILVSGNYNPADDTVTVNISNKGIPLPVDDIDKIFERGYRTQQARNTYPAGTGFGLYIAKRIIDIHEGRITASTDTLGRVVISVTLKKNPISK